MARDHDLLTEEEPLRDADDEDDRIGVFRSWRALYVTVIVYTLGLIILLYVLTRLLDKSVA